MHPLILPASITSGGIALKPNIVNNIIGGTATTIVIITAAWSPTPKRTSAGTNTAYCGIVCITNNIGYKAFSTRLLLNAAIPKPKPKINDNGAATSMNERVCIDGFHWPNIEM